MVVNNYNMDVNRRVILTYFIVWSRQNLLTLQFILSDAGWKNLWHQGCYWMKHWFNQKPGNKSFLDDKKEGLNYSQKIPVWISFLH